MRRRKLMTLGTVIFIFLTISITQADNGAKKIWEGKLPTPEDSFSSEEVTKPDCLSPTQDQDGENIRGYDPFGVVHGWREKRLLALPIWQDADLNHGFTPAEAFVYSTEENDGNVVVQLTMMSLSQEETMSLFGWNSDGEYKLLLIMNYGSNQADRHRWYGPLAQWIGTSFQFTLDQSRELTFRQSFAKFTDHQIKWTEFKTRYEKYAWLMNYYLGTDYPLRPGSRGYYAHFQVTEENRPQMIVAVEKFFRAMNWPFKDPDFFRKPGQPSIVNYPAASLNQ